jgi:hypothetical protein
VTAEARYQSERPFPPCLPFIIQMLAIGSTPYFNLFSRLKERARTNSTGKP